MSAARAGGHSRKASARKSAAIFAGGFSLVLHLAALTALLWLQFQPPPPLPAPPLEVALIRSLPMVDPEPASEAPAAEASAATQAQPVVAPPVRRTAPVPSPLVKAALRDTPDDGPSPEIGEAEISGAGTAASGPSAHGCELIRRVQEALRRDPLVLSEVSAIRRSRPGGALLVWNGDWVRSPLEDGKGLAAVREAITWEVADAPPACRSEPVHGLVVLSLREAEAAAPMKLALGAGDWRWADLLFARGAPTAALP